MTDDLVITEKKEAFRFIFINKETVLYYINST